MDVSDDRTVDSSALVLYSMSMWRQNSNKYSTHRTHAIFARPRPTRHQPLSIVVCAQPATHTVTSSAMSDVATRCAHTNPPFPWPFPQRVSSRRSRSHKLFSVLVAHRITGNFTIVQAPSQHHSPPCLRATRGRCTAGPLAIRGASSASEIALRLSASSGSVGVEVDDDSLPWLRCRRSRRLGRYTRRLRDSMRRLGRLRVQRRQAPVGGGHA